MVKQIILYFIISTTVSGQIIPELDWFVSYNGTGKGNDFVNSITRDIDDNFYFAGRSEGVDGTPDYSIMKYSIDGDSLLDIRFISSQNAWDEVNSIVVDSDKNIYSTGRASYGESTSIAIIQKYNSNGELLWHKDFQNSNEIYSEGVKIVLDKDKNVIAGINGFGINLLKYSSSGDSIWSVLINDSSSNYLVNEVITDLNSNIFAIYTRSFFDGGDVAETEINLMKIRDNGDIFWNKTIDLESPRKIVFDLDSNLVISSHGDAKILKCSLEGDLIWEYNSNGLLTDISIDKNNNIVMCGYKSGIGTFDYMIKKISTEGYDIWENSFNGIENLRDVAYSVCLDDDDNIFVAGSNSDTFSQGVSYTLKFNSEGELIWQFRYDMPHSKFEHPISVFLDDSCNIFIAGDYTDSTNGSNYFLIKILQRTGTEIEELGHSAPSKYGLSQNYPNPFNPNTNIQFTIPIQSHVKLEVFDALGRKIRELVNKELIVGTYVVNFDASEYSSGLYYYRLSTNNYSECRKAVLLK